MTEWTPGQAKKFAAQVELNRTYYTIETAVEPWGEEKVWRPWVFTDRLPILGTPTGGGVDARSACSRFGPMYDSQPTHIRGMFEQPDELHTAPADVIKVRNSRGKKAARR